MAFLAGLVSVLSPCVFPLIPAYTAYLGTRAGTGEGAPAVTGRSRAPLVANGVAFVLGFSAVFVLLFYLLEAFEVSLFVRHRREVNLVAGVVVVVFALQTLGVLRLGWLMRERRLHLPSGAGLAGSFLLGISFAAGWTPCIGPQLGAILQLAQDGSLGGLPFMVAYCLGLAIPFLLVATLAERLHGMIRAVNRRLGIINLVGGFLLMVFGLLLLTDQLTVLSRFSVETPFSL